jgi:hypothetical protein
MKTENRKGRVQAAVFTGAFWSHLVMKNSSKPTLHQYSVMGEVAYLFPNGKSIAVDAGVILGGEYIGGMFIGGEYIDNYTRLDLKQGGVVSVKGMWHFLEQKKAVPFGVTSLSVSVSKVDAVKTGNVSNSFLATDVRLGLTAGYTIRNFLQVYISPKVFGGPVFWYHGSDRVQGRDRYFIQAACGASFLLPKGFVIFVNGSALGEQAVGGGVAKVF